MGGSKPKNPAWKYADEIRQIHRVEKTYTRVATEIRRRHPELANHNISIESAIRRIILTHPALQQECEDVGLPVDDVNYYWYKGKNFSINVKNKTVDLWELKEEMIADMKQYSPKYPKIKYPKNKEGHLLVIDPADVHIGKLCKAFETGDEYNHKIAIERVMSGVEGVVEKSRGYEVDKILLILGNDILHTDTPRNTTTSGTPQDTEMMWYDAFRTARQLYIDLVEYLMQIAPVHIQYDPSNHDYITGFFLMQSIEAWFHNSKDITFNISISHRKYFQYGLNAIGTTHGDGAKETDLALLMAHECNFWNDTKYRYFYTHHIHHKKSKDYMSVTVESLRSPSGTDSWHHKNGYSHSPKAIEGYLHSKTMGQICRFTHYF
jgi:hypothetical protein